LHVHLAAELVALRRRHGGQVHLQREREGHQVRARGGQSGEPLRLCVVVGRVHDDEPRLVGEELERLDRFALLDAERQFVQWLARLQLGQQRLEQRQLFLLLLAIRAGLLDRVPQSLDAAGHDVEVGNQKVVVEVLQVGCRVGPAKVGGHDDQGARLADHRELLGAPLVRAGQSRRIDDLDRRLRDLLGVVDFAELGNPIVRDGRHRRLDRVR
jgi:hypothetical protein